MKISTGKTVAGMVRDFSGVDLLDQDLYSSQKKNRADSPLIEKMQPTVSKPGGVKNIKAKNSNGEGALKFASSKKN